MESLFNNATILIIDDEEVNLLLLERILQKAGYSNIHSTSDPRQGLSLAESLDPDLICTDLHMPHLNGFELIEELRQRQEPNQYLPIVVLTADITAEAEQEALSRGARDFITKPFKSSQIRLRIANLLQTRYLHLELQRQNERLEEKVLERTIELEAARLDILERLALAAEYRDYTTGQHTGRVGILSALLAEKLGMSSEQIDLIRRAAPLHDVGKIGVPDGILLKPGSLTDTELDTMKEHVEVGAKLLAHGHSKLIQLAEEIAWTHHERWDGSGYPRGLKGDEIPLVGQIVAVADVFDTLINERPYKRAWPLERAIAEMKRQSGRWFSPLLIQKLFQVLAENHDLLEDLGRIPDQLHRPTLAS